MNTHFIISLTFISLLMFGCGGRQDETVKSADLLFERAVQYTERGRFDEAAAAFENLIAVDTELGRTGRVVHHQRYLGIIAEQNGRIEESRSWYNRSTETSRRAASHEGVLNGMLHIASLAKTTGNSRAEYSQYNNALTYTQFFNYPRGEAVILNKLGVFEAERGRTDVAERHLTQSVHIAENLKDPELLFDTRLALARNFIRQGNFIGAKDQLDAARALERSIKDPILRIQHSIALGSYYDGVGNHAQALKVYLEAWNIHRERPHNNVHFLTLLESLADSYLQRGRYRDAVSHYTILTDLTRTYNRQIILGYSLLGLSDAYLKFGIVVDNTDYLEEAQQFAREAEAHFGHLQYFTGQAYAVFQQARAVSLIGKSSDAISLYKNALTFIRETIISEGVFPSQERFEQRNNLRNPRTAITQFLVNELVAIERYEEAFRYAEMDRQSTLNEKVLRIGLSSSDADHAAFADSLTILYRQMQGLEFSRLISFEHNRFAVNLRDTLLSMVSSTRSAIEDLQDKLSETLPNSRRLFDKDIPPLNSIQQSLTAGRTLIAYYPTQTHLHTFILDRASFNATSQEIPYEVLKVRVDLFRQSISSPLLLAVSDENQYRRISPEEHNEKARSIYDIFLRHAMGFAGASSHLIFILPPDMHDLPLHALRTPGEGDEYIVHKRKITYMPSAATLTFRLQSPRRVASIAAFGNPDGNDWNIDYELRDVRGIFRDASLYLDENASLENLRSVRGDILHLATEFFYQPRFPEHSHFILTHDRSITVGQFSLSNLTGLYSFPNIILSNSGDIIEGLDVVHPYLLFLNGSRSVLVNHWTREPRSAKWFNENVYSNLAIEYPFIDSYHEAQKTLIATPQYDDPHFWGLFFMYSP